MCSCNVSACPFYLDISDELQSWSFYGGLAVYDSLYSSCPPHGLVQHLSVKAVRVLPSIYYDVPVACVNKIQIAFFCIKMN